MKADIPELRSKLPVTVDRHFVSDIRNKTCYAYAAAQEKSGKQRESPNGMRSTICPLFTFFRKPPLLPFTSMIANLTVRKRSVMELQMFDTM